MAAKDYGFFPAGLSGKVYLAKRIKTKGIMSKDRRLIDDNEAIGVFEAYLRRFCKENNTNNLQISDEAGNVIFSATLNIDVPDNKETASK